MHEDSFREERESAPERKKKYAKKKKKYVKKKKNAKKKEKKDLQPPCSRPSGRPVDSSVTEPDLGAKIQIFLGKEGPAQDDPYSLEGWLLLRTRTQRFHRNNPRGCIMNWKN